MEEQLSNYTGGRHHSLSWSSESGSFSKYPTKKRETVTVGGHILLATKKCPPTNIFSVQFLNEPREIAETLPLFPQPIFISNTKGNFLFQRLKDFP